MSTGTLTRRSVLRGAAVVVVGGVAGFVAARRSGAASAAPTTRANGYGPSAAAGGSAAPPLAALTDVPDGGGLVLSGQHVVLVRSGSDVRGFSATCTHQGCTVSGVAGGVIVCPCHGSRFDDRTGAVVAGPAPAPLPPVGVEVRNGSVFRTGG